MITPADIKKKARRLYAGKFLKAWLNNERFFPLVIPSNKGRTTDAYGKRLSELNSLLSQEKSQIGYGYTVALKNIKTRQQSFQSVPQQVYFESQFDFLKFLRKEAEFRSFRNDTGLIRKWLPELNDWIVANPQQVIKNSTKWEDLIKVCRYFQQNPRPDLYIRELPIEVHTKFVEENKGILKMLLDYLLPPAIIKMEERSFEKRYGLKIKEDLIRIRFLDQKVARTMPKGINDLSLPISQLALLNPPCRTVFIVENIMNVLTFPSVPQSVVIWGRGYAVENLKAIPWLQDKTMIYWGDIDPQGFQILARLRSHFPKTKSIMMDLETFNEFKNYAVQAPECSVDPVNHLNAKEKRLFQNLIHKCDRNRLEQEKIPHRYALEKISQLQIE
jgi:hypothetical protein